MIKVLIAPLNWGLGHATRCIPIIDKLLAHQVEVIIASDGRALALLTKEYPQLTALTLPAYQVQYHSNNNNFVWTMFRQIPKLLYKIHQEHSQIQQIVKEHKIDVIISDNRFGCWSKQAHSIFITHQLFIQLPSSIRLLQPTLWQLNQWFIQQYDACWIPDYPDIENSLSGTLAHHQLLNSNHFHFIGALSRLGNASKEAKKRRSEEAKKRRSEEAKKQRSEEAKKQRSEEAKKQRSEEAKKQRSEEAKKQRSEEAKKQRSKKAKKQRSEEVKMRRSEEMKMRRNEEVKKQRSEEVKMRRREEVKKKNTKTINQKLRTKNDLLIVLSGPEPQRTLFEKQLLKQLATIRCSTLVVKGVTESNHFVQWNEYIQMVDHLTSKDLELVLQQAAIVVSRAGYSTIMDLVALGKTAILVPTPNQTEQEYLGQQFMERNIFYSIPQKDFDLAKALTAIASFKGIQLPVNELMHQKIEELMKNYELKTANNERQTNDGKAMNDEL